jgi:hypothetical protein
MNNILDIFTNSIFVISIATMVYKIASISSVFFKIICLNVIITSTLIFFIINSKMLQTNFIDAIFAFYIISQFVLISYIKNKKK